MVTEQAGRIQNKSTVLVDKWKAMQHALQKRTTADSIKAEQELFEWNSTRVAAETGHMCKPYF